ncbi:MAG: hypothetical protein G01um101431_878 [Parcubacteria group bacterium Gr01-1014_31]|nr:MAG: hypothetical protein G01um101431_878 [Parcubacteria group bacterium Gr01-1014_31]
MEELNHTADELLRIKDWVLRNYHNDVYPLFINSQTVGAADGVFHFGIVRNIMAYIETCGAIHSGWAELDQRGDYDTKKVATSEKSIRFIVEFLSVIDKNYRENGKLFYNMYRHGSTHLLRPHRLKSRATGMIYSWWWYSGDRCTIHDKVEGFKRDDGVRVSHLELIKVPNQNVYLLPVSFPCLCADVEKAVGNFYDSLVGARRKGDLPPEQRRALTFIANGVVTRGDI